ncbi:MAG: NAD(P)H-binding protein [Candidatus Nanopelagicales bacterium]
MTRRVLVAPGGGMFGQAVIRQLLGRDDVQIRAMVRDPAKFSLTAPNLEVVRGDMDDPASLVAPTKDVTHIFLTSPMDEHITAREEAVVDAAAANGTPHLVMIYGAVHHEGDHLDQLHQASIAHAKASGLPWTLISPTSVIETVMNPIKEQIGMGVWLGTSGHGKAALVAVDDVGRVVAEVVSGEGHEGQNYECTGPGLVDMGMIATMLGKAVDRKITYLDIPEKDFTEMLVEHAGYPDAEAVEIGVLCHFRAWRDGRAEALTDTVRRVTGQAPQSVSDWIDAHVEEFRVKPSLSDRIAGISLRAKFHGDAMTD